MVKHSKILQENWVSSMWQAPHTIHVAKVLLKARWNQLKLNFAKRKPLTWHGPLVSYNHTQHWSQTAITCWTTSWSSNPGQPPEGNPQRRLKRSSHPQTRGEAGAAKILPWQVRKATSCTNTRTKSKHPGLNDTEIETSRSERKACGSPPIICCVNPDWKRAEAH